MLTNGKVNYEVISKASRANHAFNAWILQCICHLKIKADENELSVVLNGYVVRILYYYAHKTPSYSVFLPPSGTAVIKLENSDIHKAIMTGTSEELRCRLHHYNFSSPIKALI